jgi:hypothetical protein
LHIYIRNPTVGKALASASTPKSPTVTTADGEIPAQKYRPVLKKFSGSNNWPQQSVILPGNEVMFSLETASDYIKDDKVSFVVGTASFSGFPMLCADALIYLAS